MGRYTQAQNDYVNAVRHLGQVREVPLSYRTYWSDAERVYRTRPGIDTPPVVGAERLEPI